jgi:hypothetical protein
VSELRAIFQFQVRGLWVRRELFGSSHRLERAGHRIEIALPKDENDFRTWQLLPGDDYRALGGSAGTVDDPDQMRSVSVIRVTVETEGDVTVADFADEKPEASNRATAVFDAAQALAEEVIKDFVAMIRAKHGFSWMGLSSDNIAQVGPASLVEAETARRLPVGPTLMMHSMMFPREKALTTTQVTDLIRQIETGQPVPFAESLLADAEYLAWAGDWESSDPLRAILMAAIACEVKAKFVLREGIPPEQAALLDYVLDNPREVTVTAADGLFNKVMMAAQGRSLRDDDRELFKRISRLFEVRNRVAHRGEWPATDEARELVRSARRAFEWLDRSNDTIDESPGSDGGND